jgi:hypothetical protein
VLKLSFTIAGLQTTGFQLFTAERAMRDANNGIPDYIAHLFKVVVFVKVRFICTSLNDKVPLPTTILVPVLRTMHKNTVAWHRLTAMFVFH